MVPLVLCPYLLAEENFYLDTYLLEILDHKCKFQLRHHRYLVLNNYHHQDIVHMEVCMRGIVDACLFAHA